VLLITYYESYTARQRNRLCRVQFRTERAGLRRAPRVGNIDEGRTVVTWTLLKAFCVNKGLEVRGDGGMVS
jgi:hypothetical protein